MEGEKEGGHGGLIRLLLVKWARRGVGRVGGGARRGRKGEGVGGYGVCVWGGGGKKGAREGLKEGCRAKMGVEGPRMGVEDHPSAVGGPKERADRCGRHVGQLARERRRGVRVLTLKAVDLGIVRDVFPWERAALGAMRDRGRLRLHVSRMGGRGSLAHGGKGATRFRLNVWRDGGKGRRVLGSNLARHHEIARNVGQRLEVIGGGRRARAVGRAGGEEGSTPEGGGVCIIDPTSERRVDSTAVAPYLTPPP